MPWVRALTLLVLMTVAVACGGSPAASESATSSEPTDSPAASVAASEAAASQGSVGGGGDMDQLIADLTPPNSTEITRTSAEGGVFIGWSSTDSVDSLKSFYEGAIPATGMEIFSTTNASGTFAWVFAESAGSSNGGSVTIGPATDGTSGSSVIVTLTSE